MSERGFERRYDHTLDCRVVFLRLHDYRRCLPTPVIGTKQDAALLALAAGIVASEPREIDTCVNRRSCMKRPAVRLRCTAIGGERGVS